MNEIRIQLFGAFREFGDGNAILLPVEGELTIREVKERLARRLIGTGAGASTGESGAIAARVEEAALADETKVCRDGDRVRPGQVLSILPPVCGG